MKVTLKNLRKGLIGIDCNKSRREDVRELLKLAFNTSAAIGCNDITGKYIIGNIVYDFWGKSNHQQNTECFPANQFLPKSKFCTPQPISSITLQEYKL